MVGVRVDPEKSGDLGDDASLFETFADRALCRRLADVLGTTRQGPLDCVSTALEQDGAAVVDDEQVVGRNEHVRLGGLGVAVVLSPAHFRANGRSDFRDAIDVIAKGSDWAALMTRDRFPLSQLPQGLTALRGGSHRRPFKVLPAFDT